jgi:pimeloyl-ACP methyl ester carboxylesterase
MKSPSHSSHLVRLKHGCAIVLFLALGAASLAAASLPAVPGAPGSIVTSVFIGAFPTTEVDVLQNVLFEAYAVPPAARYAVDTYRVRYVSTDYDGSSAIVSAELFVPRYAERADRPLLVFGSGTTGIGDACAPSLEQWEVRHFGDYRANMLAYAGQGFIVLFPDYIGFNDPDRPQRYFSKDAEAHAMLDGIRAVFQYFSTAAHPVRPQPKAFVAGYSQGGHAAFAAADLQRAYAPDVTLAGAIGFGATTDVEALLREGPAYAPLIFYTYKMMYGLPDIDPSRYLLDRFAKTLDQDASQMCVDQFQAYYGYDGTKVYRPEFLRELSANRIAASYPSLAKRLAENRAGLTGHGVPSLVLQGATDFIVTPATQLKFVDALRKAGSAVRYVAYKGVPHKGIRQAALAESLNWMEKIARGEAAPTQ